MRSDITLPALFLFLEFVHEYLNAFLSEPEVVLVVDIQLVTFIPLLPAFLFDNLLDAL